jgi:DNA-binding transcriptional LysR family regulator
MHRRHAKKNIPIELLRALVTVVDTRSFTKAADSLQLTQPAISAQIARLSQLLGGTIFVKGQGLTLTKRGLVVLQYARRLLAMNDELLATVGPNSTPRQLAVGLPGWMSYDQLTTVFERASATPVNQHVMYRCDRVERLVADLNLGLIDIAFLCNVQDPPRVTVAEFSDQMMWVKSPKLVLGAGAPIPLVSWPGTYPDRVAVESLDQSGMHFQISFTAPEVSARLAAVAAGLGVMAIPHRLVTSQIEIVREGLPQLPTVKSGIYAREGLDLRPLAPFLRTLTEVLAPPPGPESAPLKHRIRSAPPPRGKAAALRQAG